MRCNLLIPRRRGLDLFLARASRALLLLLGLWLLIVGIFNVNHRSDWAMGDWLINYSGGFVRRGLIGEAALLLGRLGLSPLWSVLVLQWSLYAVVLAAIWRFLDPLRWRLWLAAFIFSPATLAFSFFDPPFAFRKEVLFFALLTITLWVLWRNDLRQKQPRYQDAWLSLLLTAGCAVCILSHEGLIVFFPYLFGALLLGMRSLRRAVVCFAAPVIVSIALFALVSHYPGNATEARTICQSIAGTMTNPPSGLCGGAIDYLSHGPAYAHAQVVLVARYEHYGVSVPWLILLSMLPVALGIISMWRTRRFEARVLTGCAVVAWLLSISVFYYGTDWTRWIYVHAFSLMLLMLFAERRRQREAAPAASYLDEPMRLKQIGAIAFLLLYAFGWELTIYRQPLPLGGFVHFVRHDLLTKSGQRFIQR